MVLPFTSEAPYCCFNPFSFPVSNTNVLSWPFSVLYQRTRTKHPLSSQVNFICIAQKIDPGWSLITARASATTSQCPRLDHVPFVRLETNNSSRWQAGPQQQTQISPREDPRDEEHKDFGEEVELVMCIAGTWIATETWITTDVCFCCETDTVMFSQQNQMVRVRKNV